jgi:hypothetical protein
MELFMQFTINTKYFATHWLGNTGVLWSHILQKLSKLENFFLDLLSREKLEINDKKVKSLMLFNIFGFFYCIYKYEYYYISFILPN